MSKKLSLIIDGNYHFHKSLHVYGHYTNGPMLGTQRDQEMFMRKIAMDLAFAIRQFEKPDRIIFVIDNYSWRKDVDIDQNEGYKANRVKDESQVNWEAFNSLLKEFGEILESHGCIVSNLYGCEGDDLMYFWANKLYEDGEDVVIITGDGDINQLVKHDDNNFISVYNIKSTNRKIVGAPGFGDFLKDETVSLLDASSFMGNNKDVIKKVIDKSALEEIKPEDVLFDKILMGDGGDNVPPIIQWEEKQKNDRIINRKLTNSKAQRIKELLEGRGKKVDVTKLYEHAKDIHDEIKIIYDKKLPAKTVKEFTPELAAERIRRNTILVYLSDDTIPPEYRQSFEKHYIDVASGGYPKLEKWDMHTVLKGTKWEKGPETFEADIFSKMGKKSKAEVQPKQESKKLF